LRELTSDGEGASPHGAAAEVAIGVGAFEQFFDIGWRCRQGDFSRAVRAWRGATIIHGAW
jgi:hypothetical protein